jgi:hypothetical protein
MPSEKNAVREADCCHLNMDAKGLRSLYNVSRNIYSFGENRKADSKRTFAFNALPVVTPDIYRRHKCIDRSCREKRNCVNRRDL